MASYPKWLYHATSPAVVVKDEAEHKALGEGWVESPALVVAKKAELVTEAAPEAAPEAKPAKKVK